MNYLLTSGRAGADLELIYEPFSLTETLLATDHGKTARIPFQHIKSKVEVANSSDKILNAFRRFVANCMKEKGFEGYQEPALDIIAEVLEEYVVDYLEKQKEG